VIRPSFQDRLQNLTGELGFTSLLQERVIDRADKIITLSQLTKQRITSAYKVPPSKVNVIPLGIDPEFYQEKFNEYEKKDDARDFVLWKARKEGEDFWETAKQREKKAKW
jgi:glycosyltransferase involved in cell wall biosynthesis